MILWNFTSNVVKAPRTTGTNYLGTVTERHRKPLPQDSQKAKEEADLAECQKKFCVASVPEHVSKPLYDDIIHEQERLRKEGREQRRDFLLTMQKPFRFHKREEKKQERLKEEMASADKSEKTEPVCVRKPIPKAFSDPSFSEQFKGAIYLNIYQNKIQYIISNALVCTKHNMKSSDAKACKCHLKLSSEISIFTVCVGLVISL